MEIDFVDPYGPVTFKPAEIAGNSTFEDRMPVTKQRIANILKRGPIITNDIAKELNKSYHSVATRLNEMRKEGKVLRMPDGSWGLVHVGN
jgi:Mn-dependent DtxR family transcriptional regulator